jgi:hypothetical protein
MEDCLFYLEQRISDLEKRLLYHEKKEYYKYLVAGQNQKVLETMFLIEHEPKKEIKPKRLWMSYHK